MKIVGMMIVGNGEADRYLEGSLKELKRLCDDAIICGNNTDPKTEKLISKYGFWFYRDDREWGLYQPDIKGDLLKKVGRLGARWVIAIDADEKFAPEFTREEAEQLAMRKEIAYYFLVVNLYGDPDHFVHGPGIQRFWNIRFFKYSDANTVYQKKRLHCGLAPPIYYHRGWHAPYYLEHYGLMTEDDRQRKVERYNKYDPSAKFKPKVYYDELKNSLKPQIFYRDRLLEKLSESSECKPRDINNLKYL